MLNFLLPLKTKRKQVDVLPSKNQALCVIVNQCIVIVLNDVISESLEQRFITKEDIATHANLILLFKPALYSSTLVKKLFKSSIKLFYAEILTATS